MAEVAYTATRPLDGGSVLLFSWAGLTDGDTGDVIARPGPAGAHCTVQFTTSTSGPTTMQVSNDGTNWDTMKDTGGNDVTVTSGNTGAFEVQTAAIYMRPLGGTSLTEGNVSLAFREAFD